MRDISDSTNNDETASKRSSLRTPSFNSKALLNGSSNTSSSTDHSAAAATTNSTADNNITDSNKQQLPRPTEMVLKVTSISSRHQRDIAEKEARLLAKLSHPSIVKMFDTGYRSVPISSSHHHAHQTTGGVISNAFRSNKSCNNNNSSTRTNESK